MALVEDARGVSEDLGRSFEPDEELLRCQRPASGCRQLQQERYAVQTPAELLEGTGRRIPVDLPACEGHTIDEEVDGGEPDPVVEAAS